MWAAQNGKATPIGSVDQYVCQYTGMCICTLIVKKSKGIHIALGLLEFIKGRNVNRVVWRTNSLRIYLEELQEGSQTSRSH